MTAVDSLLEHLNALPDSEVLTVSDLTLTGRWNLKSGSGRRALASLIKNRYQVTLSGSRTWVYGNEKAIRNLQSQLKDSK